MPAKTAGPRNRFWLIVVGVLLLIAGLAGLGLGTATLAHLSSSNSWFAAAIPKASRHVFGNAHPTSLLATMWPTVLVTIIAIIIGLLGLTWLSAQIPKPSRSPTLQLHDDARTGTITIPASTLAGTLEQRISRLDGVADSTITISGTADHPDTAARLTITPQTEIADLLTQTRDQITADLNAALETPPERLTLHITGIAAEQTSNRHITL